MKRLADCLLYTFIDTGYLRDRDPGTIARQLIDGGSDIVQLRAKGWPRDQVRALANDLWPLLEAAGVPLVINDDPQVALEIGAPFCHLGQEDFFDSGYAQTGDVLRACSSGLKKEQTLGIGLSSHAPEQAERAVRAGAEYIAIGPVYATGTKPTARPVTLEYVRWAAGTWRSHGLRSAGSTWTTWTTCWPPAPGGSASSRPSCWRPTRCRLASTLRSAYCPLAVPVYPPSPRGKARVRVLVNCRISFRFVSFFLSSSIYSISFASIFHS